MALITLQNDNARATIDTVGAWLLDYTHASQPILFPKQTFTLPDGSQKVRGGCHVCLPNFGPGGGSGLPQHGFGRELEWEVLEQSDDSVVLALSQGVDAYSDLYCELTYRLDDGVFMELRASNKGDQALRISPAFHPYFVANNEATVIVDDETFSLDSIHEARFLAGEPSRLRIGPLDIRIAAKNLSQWVLWTDQLGDYVCLEPSLAGFEFLELETQAMLEPGKNAAWSMMIAV